MFCLKIKMFCPRYRGRALRSACRRGASADRKQITQRRGAKKRFRQLIRAGTQEKAGRPRVGGVPEV